MKKMQLSHLNEAIAQDVTGFMTQRDQGYDDQVTACADRVAENLSASPIILLAGPSGSGKTTTATRLSQALSRRGVQTHAISLDDYYLDFSPETYPKTETGEPDLESPMGLDIPLLNQQLSQLDAGEEILVPHFDFTVHKRDPKKQRPLRLRPDEAVVFEGLHALNPMFLDRHPKAFGLYVSSLTDIVDGEELVLRHDWVRLLRRCVRDLFHRASDIEETMSLWKNVCRGEDLFITPYRTRAKFQINTSLCYELPVLGAIAKPLLECLPPDAPQRVLTDALLRAIDLAAPIELDLVPENSLLRAEFLK